MANIFDRLNMVGRCAVKVNRAQIALAEAIDHARRHAGATDTDIQRALELAAREPRLFE